MTFFQPKSTNQPKLPDPIAITDKTIFTDEYKGYLNNLGKKDAQDKFIVTPEQLKNLKEAVKKFIGVKSEFEIGISSDKEGSALFSLQGNSNELFLSVSVHSPKIERSDNSKKFHIVVKYDEKDVSALFVSPTNIEVKEHEKFSSVNVTNANVNVGNAIFKVTEKHKDEQLSFAGTSSDGTTFIVTAPTAEAKSKLPKDFENHDRLFILKGDKFEEMKVLERSQQRRDSGFTYSFKNAEGRIGYLSFPGINFGEPSGTPDIVTLSLPADKTKNLPYEKADFKPIR